MTRLLATAAFLIFCYFCMAQAKPIPAVNTQRSALTEGARLLFSGLGSKLAPAEQNAIYRQLGLQVVPGKKAFRMDGFDVGARAYPVDLNKDGVEEVFVVMTGLLFGNTGQGVALFIKEGVHGYVKQDEVAGGIAVIMDTQHGGYPDLVIAGPGFEFPLYRWNGKSYIYTRNISDDDLQNANTKTVEEYSRMHKEELSPRD